MHLFPALIAAAIAAAQGGAATDSGAKRSEPRGPEASALLSLCVGSDLCREVVLMRRDGVALVRVMFVHPAAFVDEDEDYCDRREYWHVRGEKRILLARDCAEQSGADSQGPIEFRFDRGKLELAYTEWLSSDGCEKTIIDVDWQTSKWLSSKRWSGTSTHQRRECARLKRVKFDLRPGAGTGDDPMVTFHRD